MPAPPQKRPGEGRITTSIEATFTRLTYIGLAHLNLCQTEIDLMIFGELLDLVDCWLIDTGRAEPVRHWFIDDIIPAGI